MSSPAGLITIYNRALQLLGAKRVVSPSDNSVSSRACNVCYDVLRQAELRKHWWRFAIKRASLPAISPQPDSCTNGFVLPADSIKLFDTYPNGFVDVGMEFPEGSVGEKKFELEGRTIFCDYDAPLLIRYISDVTDTTLMDPLFREALSASMALNMCEELTQSSGKQQLVGGAYTKAMLDAKKANAFETVAQDPPQDLFIACRR